MTEALTPSTDIQATGENLFHFAIDREDIKWLSDRLPETAAISKNTLEYELQILKIISVGWFLSYYLQKSPQKQPLSEGYWQAVQEFSKTLSDSSSLMTGRSIDYFQILKDRLNTYVSAMESTPGVSQPAAVIGPEFARCCGNAEDPSALLAGRKLFVSVMSGLRDYLSVLGMY